MKGSDVKLDVALSHLLRFVVQPSTGGVTEKILVVFGSKGCDN